MKKIAIIYGPLKGSTEKVAKMVAEEFGNENVDLIPVGDAINTTIGKYSNIIFGVSTVGKHTWDSDHEGGNWDKYMPEIGRTDMSGKTVAIFGLGDHVTYSLHFVDAVGILSDLVEKSGGTLIGQVSTEGYEFEDSQAVRGDVFLGLPIDEDYDSDKTPERIKNWVAQIKKDFQ
jgi:flavodoxin I